MKLDLSTLPQPDDTTCGPTCLHAVYGYWGIDIPLGELIAQVPSLPEGGTLAGMLACHALKRGLQATIYTYNLRLFDPTWFQPGVDLAVKLRAQAAAKPDVKLQHATATYLRFLSLGGQVRFAELNADLIHEHLRRQRPILTGLSATYLYGCAREREDDHDDIRGEPAGHFVILRGFDTENATVDVVDPLADNPLTDDHHYEVGVDRLIGAILLGVLSWDAVLLVLEPKRSP